MSNKTITFEEKKINRSNFYKNKKLFNLHGLEVNKILVSKKESYGKKNSLKYFMLNTLIVIRQCLLRLVIITY